MANPNPKTEQLIPFKKVGDKPLSKKPLHIRLPQNDYDDLMEIPRDERLSLVRAAIAKALTQRKEKLQQAS